MTASHTAKMLVFNMKPVHTHFIYSRTSVIFNCRAPGTVASFVHTHL